MQVFRSNRAEVLARALSAVLSKPVGGPLDQEVVVVHSRGMERWLQMQLAEHLGIAASVDFPTPGRLIQQVFAAVVGRETEALDAWSVDRLQWSILAVLPELMDHPDFAPVRAYLKGDGEDGRMRMQLAGRISEVFGRYLTFRLDLINRWTGPEGAAESGWQPRLFRALVEHTPVPHMGALAQRFFARLPQALAEQRGLSDGPAAIPERICLFGISTLAPFTVEVLTALSHHVEVFLFVLAPTQEWAADAGRITGSVPQGHPLVGTMGRLGRDFQWVLEQHGPGYDETVGTALFEDPCEGPDAPFLAQLQADVLHLRSPGQGGLPRGTISTDDRSLRFHACHGPMRQVEVLHDELLRLFQADPTLRPRDVVVMCPDIAAMAPLIEAVFARRPDDLGPPPIPFRVSDRSLRSGNPVAEAVLAVFELARGRLPASQVLDLLSLAPVRARFKLDVAELDTLREWVRQSGVRWGRDAPHRADHGQPTYAENTWRFGLDRLLVGTSIRGEGRRTFAGVLPYDEIEGSTGDLLGKLVAFWEALGRCVAELEEPTTADGWQARVQRILEGLLTWEDDDAWQARAVLRVANELAVNALSSGFEETLALPLMLDLLAGRLESSGSGGAFLSGGVTVCAMVPLRAIPFRVVVLLGLDDGSFPRADPKLGFDLMSQDRRRGDRSPRDEDRTLFLEALLSARDTVVITWTGRSVQTNEPLPPAVPVGELLDLLTLGYQLDGAPEPGPAEPDEALRAHLLTEHPLQPFSPQVYQPDPRRQSFEPLYLPAARAMLGARQAEPPFVTEILPAPEGEPELIELDHLVRFLRGPVPWLLNRRLGVWLRQESLGLDDREPAELNALERYSVGTVLLERALQGDDLSQAFELARAAGVLPPGTPGRELFDRIRQQVQPIAATTTMRRAGGPREPVDIDLTLGRVRIVGQVGDRYEGATVSCRFGRLKGEVILAQWVRHLALCASGIAEPSWFVGRGTGPEGVEELGLGPVADARATLTTLAAIFTKGQDRPLPFFPRSSRAYAETLLEDPDNPSQRDKALKAAAAGWSGTWGTGFDLDEPHVNRVFAGQEPYQPAWDPEALDLPPELHFDALATAIWWPLLRHRVDP